MKTKYLQLLALLALIASSIGAKAQFYDFDISATRQTLDQDKSREDGSVTVTTKDIVYKVTLQNKSSKDYANIQVKYMIFYIDPQFGTKEKPKEASQPGSEAIALLKSHAQTIFTTKPVKLTHEELDGGWVFANGASGRAKDRVNGVWIRAYVDGKLMGEYMNPSSLSQRRSWKD